MRLAKYLAHAGVASRRAAETVIAGGRVSVDGKIVLDPAWDVDEDNRVTVDPRRALSMSCTSHWVCSQLLTIPTGVQRCSISYQTSSGAYTPWDVWMAIAVV
jgi:ribosomal protein S4